eukprot:GHVS01025675.1.p1 GENE.GHVS01025675.1~~GHVS01025675.1.p1  ORF type:complete len:465 (+),score=75.40 GHVS01025675.1:68-1462(+)
MAWTCLSGSWIKVLLLLSTVAFVTFLVMEEERWSQLVKAPRQRLSFFTSQLQRIQQTPQDEQELKDREKVFRRSAGPQLNTHAEKEQQKAEALPLQEQERHPNEAPHIQDQQKQQQQEEGQQVLSPSSPSLLPFPTAQCPLPKKGLVMSQGDKAMYERTFASVAASVQTRPIRYHEWGSGGSTLKAAYQGRGGSKGLVGDVVIRSVENYLPWCRNLAQDLPFKCLLENKLLTYICVQPVAIENMLAWGMPKRMQDYGSFDIYVRGIGVDVNEMVEEKGIFVDSKIPQIPKQDEKTFKNLPPGQLVEGKDGEKAAVVASTLHLDNLPLPVPSLQPDIILVDGRYRVTCALMTLLYVHPLSVVLIHDFWNRPAYTTSKLLSHFYDIRDGTCRDEEAKCTLVVLKPRQDVVAELQAAHAKARKGGKMSDNNKNSRNEKMTDLGEDGESSSIVSLWQSEIMKYRRIFI